MRPEILYCFNLVRKWRKKRLSLFGTLESQKMRFFWTPAGALEGVNFCWKSNFLITQIFFAENPWGPKNPPPKSVDPTLETPSPPRLCTAFSQNRSHELYRKSTKSHIIFPHHPPENMWIWAKWTPPSISPEIDFFVSNFSRNVYFWLWIVVLAIAYNVSIISEILLVYYFKYSFFDFFAKIGIFRLHKDPIKDS